MGFLRTYSTYLKLDADAMVEAYKSVHAHARLDDAVIVRTDITSAPRSRTSAERKKQRIRRQYGGYAVAGVIAVVVVALLAWFTTGRGEEAASLSAENITSSTLTTAAPLAAGTSDVSEASGDAEGDGSGGSQPGATGTTNSAATTERASSAGGGVEDAVDAEPGESIKMVLTVAEQQCWLVVRQDSVDGVEVFAGTLSAGGKQTFDRASGYWVMAGNPDVLSISVNDRSYTVNEPAGAFLVTRAGVKRVQQ